MQPNNVLLSRIADVAGVGAANVGVRVDLARGHQLVECGAEPSHVFFPLSGIVALEGVLSAGQTIELAMIDRTGCVGLQSILGARGFAHQARARTAVPAVRLGVDEINRLARLDVARRLFADYSSRAFDEVAQISLCNGSHTVLERLCRWLLTARDCLGDSVLQATQEDMMRALGVAHTAVRGALAELEEADAITARRGRVIVRSVSRLEATACECYRAIRLARLSGTDQPHVVPRAAT